MISVAIKHAPWSSRRAELVDAIRLEVPSALVVRDERRNVWHTARRAWECATGSHHVVVDDDVVLPRGFLDGLRVGDYAIFLCSSPGGALCMPTRWIRKWLRWCDENVRPDYPHDDARLHLWLTRCGRPFERRPIVGLADVPSLLGHSPSTTPNLELAWRHARKEQP